MRRRSARMLLALALLLPACREPGPAAEGQRAEPPPETAAPAPAARLALDEGGGANALATARFLAGMPAAGDGEPYPAALTTPAWAAHAAAMDEAWSRVEAEHLAPVRSWVASDAAESALPKAPLFYPFGGPDLVNALHFFPEASEYILVGLEPPGEIPSLESMDPETLASELESLRVVLDNVVEAGYFIRKRMREGLEEESASGMASVFYIQLARLGLSPRRVRYLALDREGRASELERLPPEGPRALRIDFGRPGEEATRSLYFFSQDLSDEGLAANPGFGRFVAARAPFHSFLKSAQYLPHMQEAFGEIDRLVLAHSESVLQDDSGLPLALFAEERWRLAFFGTYEGTLPAYRDWQQEDLIAAYRRAESRPLPFAMGYNSKIDGGCLILALRRAE